jgi:hypothetical protein
MEVVAAEWDRGRAECESDIGNGRLRFYWQTRGAWGEYMTNLMAERFRLQVIHTGDITNAAESSFHTGYNERMLEHINSIFGVGSLELALADVEAFRLRRYHEHFGSGNQ